MAHPLGLLAAANAGLGSVAKRQSAPAADVVRMSAPGALRLTCGPRMLPAATTPSASVAATPSAPGAPPPPRRSAYSVLVFDYVLRKSEQQGEDEPMSVVDDHPRTLPRLDDAGRALLFTEARTANTFAGTPVGDAELEGIWELARWAPTAANTHTVDSYDRFKELFKDHKILAQVAGRDDYPQWRASLATDGIKRYF